MNAFAKHIHEADKEHTSELQKQGISTAPAPCKEPNKDYNNTTIRNLVNLNPDIKTDTTNFNEIATSQRQHQTLTFEKYLPNADTCNRKMGWNGISLVKNS